MKRNPKKENNEEEIIFEDDVLSSGSSDVGRASDKVAKLKQKIKKLEDEKKEYLDGWQRAKAELINFKKRCDEDRKGYIKYSNEEFVGELLPVLDSFDMAFKDKDAWEKAPENWRKGVEYIHNQLINILNLHNVTIIDPLGLPFDPKEHNSIESVGVSSEEEAGKVVQVVVKGYKIHDKVLRPPNVKVGKYE